MRVWTVRTDFERIAGRQGGVIVPTHLRQFIIISATQQINWPRRAVYRVIEECKVGDKDTQRKSVVSSE